MTHEAAECARAGPAGAADAAVAGIGATAHTRGGDIGVRRSALRSDTLPARALLAHELVHAAQQADTGPTTDADTLAVRAAEQGAGERSLSSAGIVDASSRSAGQPLDASARAFYERRFAHDFSTVRIHTGPAAAAAADALQARAFTRASNVYFGLGEYSPATSQGRALIAHELAHVVQQTLAGTGGPQTSSLTSQPQDPSEREADTVANDLISGQTVNVQAKPQGQIQRQALTQSSSDTAAGVLPTENAEAIQQGFARLEQQDPRLASQLVQFSRRFWDLISLAEGPLILSGVIEKGHLPPVMQLLRGKDLLVSQEQYMIQSDRYSPRDIRNWLVHADTALGAIGPLMELAEPEVSRDIREAEAIREVRDQLPQLRALLDELQQTPLVRAENEAIAAEEQRSRDEAAAEAAWRETPEGRRETAIGFTREFVENKHKWWLDQSHAEAVVFAGELGNYYLRQRLGGADIQQVLEALAAEDPDLVDRALYQGELLAHLFEHGVRGLALAELPRATGSAFYSGFNLTWYDLWQRAPIAAPSFAVPTPLEVWKFEVGMQWGALEGIKDGVQNTAMDLLSLFQLSTYTELFDLCYNKLWEEQWRYEQGHAAATALHAYLQKMGKASLFAIGREFGRLIGMALVEIAIGIATAALFKVITKLMGMTRWGKALIEVADRIVHKMPWVEPKVVDVDAAPDPFRPAPPDAEAGAVAGGETVGGSQDLAATAERSSETAADTNIDEILSEMDVAPTIEGAHGVEPLPKAAAPGLPAHARSERDVTDTSIDVAPEHKQSMESATPEPIPEEISHSAPLGTGDCFVAGTLVHAEHGAVRIEALRVGDRVTSFDPRSGTSTTTQVSRLFVRTVPVILEIEVGGTVVICSPEHPFWVPGSGWCKAESLNSGTALLARGEQLVTVRSLCRREGSFRVFNLSVNGCHTYRVSDLAILVHNKAVNLEGRTDLLVSSTLELFVPETPTVGAPQAFREQRMHLLGEARLLKQHAISLAVEEARLSRRAGGRNKEEVAAIIDPQTRQLLTKDDLLDRIQNLEYRIADFAEIDDALRAGDPLSARRLSLTARRQFLIRRAEALGVSGEEWFQTLVARRRPGRSTRATTLDRTDAALALAEHELGFRERLRVRMSDRMTDQQAEFLADLLRELDEAGVPEEWLVAIERRISGANSEDEISNVLIEENRRAVAMFERENVRLSEQDLLRHRGVGPLLVDEGFRTIDEPKGEEPEGKLLGEIAEARDMAAAGARKLEKYTVTDEERLLFVAEGSDALRNFYERAKPPPHGLRSVRLPAAFGDRRATFKDREFDRMFKDGDTIVLREIKNYQKSVLEFDVARSGQLDKDISFLRRFGGDVRIEWQVNGRISREMHQELLDHQLQHGPHRFQVIEGENFEVVD
ncbi:MAG: eCIS core domain-containing protein [Pseudonocardiaceae bacterium]